LKNKEITIAPILIALSQLYFKGVDDESFVEVWEELLADDSAKTFFAYCKDKTYLPEEFIAMLGRWLLVCLKKDLIRLNYSSEEIDSTFALSIGEAIEELWKNKEERNG
jgi:hypothetical protein